MKSMKILVVGGTHGNELLGVRLIRLLRKNPLQDVDVLLANPWAFCLHKRFVDSDLNRSFGSNFPGTYESMRATFINKKCKAYDLVLDFHNTETPDNNCVFVGEACNTLLLSAAKQFGFDKCIEATYDCINKFNDNVMSIEISQGDRLDDPEYWYDKIKNLSLYADSNQPITMYKFLTRVTWQQKRKLKINNWEPFMPIDELTKLKMGLDGTIVPIFIGSKLTDFYATLLSKERTL